MAQQSEIKVGPVLQVVAKSFAGRNFALPMKAQIDFRRPSIGSRAPDIAIGDVEGKLAIDIKRLCRGDPAARFLDQTKSKAPVAVFQIVGGGRSAGARKDRDAIDEGWPCRLVIHPRKAEA